MVPFCLRNWIASVRSLKLSAWVGALFAAALVLPWGAFAWLTLTERTEQTHRVEQNLAPLASAYGEHAATLIRLSGNASQDADQFEKELAAFRSALNAPGVKFSLRRIAKDDAVANGPGALTALAPAFDEGSDNITAEVTRPGAGIAAAAAISKELALADWRARALAEAIALCLRSVLVIGVGLFLIQQLRRRERAEAELVSARKAAESASRAKSEFLANMSHELRTPLNAILGFSEIIKSRTFGPVNERYANYAGDIFNSGAHLLALINDILNLSKLEAGQLTLDEEDFDLGTTVEDCVGLVENQARRSNIRVCVALDEVCLIRADERRLRQILINLLSNAVKFTPAGGEVRVSSIKRNDGLAICVSDTGIGMAPEDIPKALAPFGQVDSKVRRKLEGTGLGLPLAKKLVELHGGTFAIDSKLNAGTTVSFVLPAKRILETRARAVPARATA
jgi:signal transduction histidine kinase